LFGFLLVGNEPAANHGTKAKAPTHVKKKEGEKNEKKNPAHSSPVRRYHLN